MTYKAKTLAHRDCPTRGHGRVPVLLALLLIALLVTACAQPRETERTNLRKMARDESIPRRQRISHLLDILRGVSPGDQTFQADPHYRATAAQMLGEMRAESQQLQPRSDAFEMEASTDPVSMMLAILGGMGVSSPDPSQYLRGECVTALTAYQRVELFEQLRLLVYTEDNWDSSEFVRRNFIQAFALFPAPRDGWPTVTTATLVTTLVKMLDAAEAKKENPSLKNRLYMELARLSSNATFAPDDFQAWRDEAAAERQRAQRHAALDALYRQLLDEWLAATNAEMADAAEIEQLESEILDLEDEYARIGIALPDARLLLLDIRYRQQLAIWLDVIDPMRGDAGETPDQPQASTDEVLARINAIEAEFRSYGYTAPDAPAVLDELRSLRAMARDSDTDG